MRYYTAVLISTNKKCSDAPRTDDLECVSRPDILELLADLCWRPVQLLGDALLLGWLQSVELLAEVAVQHVLHRVVVRSKSGLNQYFGRLQRSYGIRQWAIN